MGAHGHFAAHGDAYCVANIFAPLFCYASSDTYRSNSPWLGHDYLDRFSRII